MPWKPGALPVARSTPPDWSTMRSTALSEPATRSSWRLSIDRLPVRESYSTTKLCESRSAASAVCSLKSSRMRRWVSSPTATAKVHRIANVSPAEVMARRQRMGRRSSTQDVPRAADRVQQSRLAAGLELAPQVGDEDLDGVRLRERVVAPDLVEQPLARDDDALVAHQVLEQLELALGELDVALAAADLVRVRVEREIARGQRGGAARRAAAQQGAHPGEELLALERLDQVVVRAGVQPLDARLQCVAGGEHEDRDVTVGAQALGDLEAVQAGQAEVEQDDVGHVGAGIAQRAFAIADEAHLVALQAQRALQRLVDLHIVFHDQHAGRASLRRHGEKGRPAPLGKVNASARRKGRRHGCRPQVEAPCPHAQAREALIRAPARRRAAPP